LYILKNNPFIICRPTAPHQRSSSVAPPDVGKYNNQQLPIPTLTTPLPVRMPSTQPQPPPSMPPQQPSSSRGRPENITVQPSNDPNAPIRPVSIRNRSPAVSHRSLFLPPDNYIPTLGSDSMISLPPPHELSMPVAPEAAPLPVPPPLPIPPAPSQRPRSNSRASGEPSSSSRVHDYAYRDQEKSSHRQHDQRSRESRRYPPPTRAMSVTSRSSTHISELPLVSPPRDYFSQDHRSERDGRSERYAEKSKQREYPRASSPVSPTPRREALDSSRLVPNPSRQEYDVSHYLPSSSVLMFKFRSAHLPQNLLHRLCTPIDLLVVQGKWYYQCLWEINYSKRIPPQMLVLLVLTATLIDLHLRLDRVIWRQAALPMR